MNVERWTMTKDKHITILAILNIVRGGIVLLIGLIGFTLLLGIGAISGDPTALGVLGLIGTLAVIVMGVIGIPSILAGVGLLQRREWGRILALVVGFLSLFDVPIGTALGVYTIVVLLDDEAKKCFGSGIVAQPIVAVQAVPK
jgi:hypothetical protein